jgi:hypothetical protein
MRRIIPDQNMRFVWKLTRKLTILQREAPYFNLWKYTKVIEILYELNQSLNTENNWVYKWITE